MNPLTVLITIGDVQVNAKQLELDNPVMEWIKLL